jgi:hypothetical protein
MNELLIGGFLACRGTDGERLATCEMFRDPSFWGILVIGILAIILVAAVISFALQSRGPSNER